MNSIHIHTEQQSNKTLSLPHVRDVLCWLLVVQEIRLLVIGWKLIVFVIFLARHARGISHHILGFM